MKRSRSGIRSKAGRGADVERMLPLKPRWLHVLLAVAGGSRHGYAIRQEVEARTSGRVRLWPATLYGSLEELRERGWIEELADPEERPEGESERKRIYRVTGIGRKELEGEALHLEGEAAMARERLLGEAG